MKRTLISILGFLVSGALFTLAVRGVEWSKAPEIISTANKLFILLGAFSFICAYALKWFRWHYILRDISQDIRPSASMPAFFISFLLNNIFPLRAGEVFRVVHLAKRTSLQMRSITCTLLIDRIFDGLALVVLLGVSLKFFNLPLWVARLFYTSLALFLGALVSLYVFLLLRHRTLPALRWLPHTLSERVSKLIGNIAEALQIIKDYKEVSLLLFLSLLVWSLESLMYFVFAHAFHLNLSFVQAVLVMAVVNFGIMIPSSPGFIGTFQFFCVKTLALFGATESQGLVYALTIHLVQYVILSVAGGLFVVAEGFSFEKLKNSSAQIAADESGPMQRRYSDER